MKKLFSVLMVCVMVLSLFGCGAKNEASNNSNKLVVALNAEFPPYEYKDGGEITGIDPDMAREIGKRLGMEVEFIDIAFDSVIPAIQSGKADLAATGLTVTEDRKNFVNFTDMYQDAVQVIIVTEDSGIKSKDDMDGKNIGVQTGTTGDMYCTDELKNANVLRFPKILDGVQGLITGKVDACVVDDQVA
ncbi:MAG: transporter substrate-binding domain-containing protein, partial [Lachnospiraceae bacterium]|nr:transporter substrate-binding domain-containing protein [Lachnospiraceae bacterium]